MPEAGPLRQQLEFLLNGFSFYSRREQVSADDLLVRERAAAELGAATGALRELASAYRRRFIPDPSREQPLPPAGALAGLRAVESLRAEVADAGVRVRGQVLPALDRTWARLRTHQAALELALEFDRGLIQDAAAVRDACQRLGPGDLGPDPGAEPAALAPVRLALAALERTLLARAAHLTAQP